MFDEQKCNDAKNNVPAPLLQKQNSWKYKSQFVII